MSDATLWWIVAGIAVSVELLTGTFYLLMVALGLAAGAVAAHLGLALTWQIVAAAVVGSGATAAWHRHRASKPRSAPAASNRDVNLDIGERVSVPAWEADQTARVNYRGAGWAARFAGPGNPAPGEHVIVAIEGTRLVLAPASN